MKYLLAVISVGVFLQVAIATSVRADVTAPGETFEFTTKADGTFTLEMDAVLSPGVSLSEAHQALLNPKNLSDVSKIISKASVETSGPSTYSLITAWGRYGINKQLISDCTENLSANAFEEACKLRVTKNAADANDKGQTGTLFTSGGTDTTCAQNGSSVVCSMKVFGQAKPLHVMVFSKSGADMALNGAGFSLHDTSLILEMLSDQKNAAQVSESYTGSNLEALVLALYNQLEPNINSLPAGRTVFAQGDTRSGISSFKTGLR